MDEITCSVKDMYEHYPYPSGEPNMRAGFNVSLALSYVEKKIPKKKPLHALDAGCGRALGLIGAATIQPDITFLGADINTVALADARQNVQNRNLNNINFVQANLMTMEGIDVPLGGFDVIFSSGVLHHLADPKTGLENLKKILAPHGVISLMLYGSYGRQPLYRLIDGIAMLSLNEQQPIKDQIPAARLLSQVADETIFKNNSWQGTSQVNDIEFVDRCLNANETSYDINSLWQLLQDTGMKFVRWTNANEWSTRKLFQNQQLQTQLNFLSELEQYRLIEKMFDRPKLELIICKDSNMRRKAMSEKDIGNATFAVNPEVSFLVEKRNLNQSQRIESICYKIKTQGSQKVTDPLIAQAMLLLVDQTTNFKGMDMIQALKEKGADRLTATRILVALLNEEILYSPH